MTIAINPGWFNATLLAEIHGKDAERFLKLPETRAFIRVMTEWLDNGFEELADRRDGDILLSSNFMHTPFTRFLRTGDDLLDAFECELDYACIDAELGEAATAIAEYRAVAAYMKANTAISKSL
ncbi:hypothetical protein [uncultured Halomonas sp.]|uniref:hypothetical protein n=1 Tax=uncultured Halomonas sp. TaxID=173971 RepID=UPI002635C34D|nr:hypothetical protein [uncultured Halomonas sp.]